LKLSICELGSTRDLRIQGVILWNVHAVAEEFLLKVIFFLGMTNDSELTLSDELVD
jgi:hypothetical protein